MDELKTCLWGFVLVTGTLAAAVPIRALRGCASVAASTVNSSSSRRNELHPLMLFPTGSGVWAGVGGHSALHVRCESVVCRTRMPRAVWKRRGGGQNTRKSFTSPAGRSVVMMPCVRR